MASGSTLPTGSRKVSTEWHPDWRLLNGNVRDVVIENVEITGFDIAIHSQARAPHGVRGTCRSATTP